MTITITDTTKSPLNIASGGTSNPFADIQVSNPIVTNQYGTSGGGGDLKIHLYSTSALTKLGSIADSRLTQPAAIDFDPKSYTYTIHTYSNPPEQTANNILDRLTYFAPNVPAGTAADVQASVSFTGSTADASGRPITQTVTDPSLISLHVAAPAIIPTDIGAGPDAFTFSLSEDAFQGDAQVILSVDGKQQGGVQTVTALHNAGASQDFVVHGDFGYGPHTVSASFVNDAWGGSGGGDRNLFVDGIKFNGDTIPASSGALWSNGTATFQKPETGDKLVLTMAEDAWSGDAQATFYMDGHQIGSQFITAANSQGATQDLTFLGNWGPGPHTVGVQFNNDAWGGNDSADRNLFLKGASYDGNPVAGAHADMWSGGVYSFNI